MAKISSKKMSWQLKDKIHAQAVNEMIFSRQYKQPRVMGWWQKNENLYYGKKEIVDDARSNIDIAKMQGFVHTLLSKIDNPMTFKFSKKKDADTKPVKRANALKDSDADDNDWEMKDLLGKKQMSLYGRAVYFYSASSDGKMYKSTLTNTDVYDFLIDPSGGGLDVEEAWYLGRYGVILSRAQITEGVKDGRYDRQRSLDLMGTLDESEDDEAIESGGNANQLTQEEANKRNRQNDVTTFGQREIANPDKFKMWEWFTTYNGTRYYLLMTESQAIRVVPLTDVFKSNLWPVWTYAAFPDLTEFWTPSYADYAREIFMGQAVSINQMVDNAEAVNKPMKGVNISKVVNKAQLKYKKDGVIEFKDIEDVNKVIMMLTVPSIETPIKVFEILEDIWKQTSGVNDGTEGMAQEDKVAIYEGNQANIADRFGLLNKSYTRGYKRFAKLWLCGVEEHLTQKKAIELIGEDGLEIVDITKKDLKGYADFKTNVEASDAEFQADNIDKKNKLEFLTNLQNNPNLAQQNLVNQKAIIERQGVIAGFTTKEMQEILDTQDYGDEDLMSEASVDIEKLLDGEDPDPNLLANVAYQEKILHYARDHRYLLGLEKFKAFMAYIDGLTPIVMKNMASHVASVGLSTELTLAGQQQPGQQVGPDGKPVMPDAQATAAQDPTQPVGPGGLSNNNASVTQ